jgi:hypothetical protein
MSSIYCLLNHKLTPKQETELHDSFGTVNIMYPPQQITELWSKIPTVRELSKTHLKPFTAWLQEATEGDVTVLQGEFSATFALIDFVLRRGLIPVCAVTKREAQESRVGEKIIKEHTFNHICFRRYRYYEDLNL